MQDDELDIPGLAKTGGKMRFSRSAWGSELRDLLESAISLLYEPELQVDFVMIVGLGSFTSA